MSTEAGRRARFVLRVNNQRATALVAKTAPLDSSRLTGFAKRAAINAPIQGTAADVIRRAMIRMPDAISHLPARMLLQVHDELLFEVPESAVDETIETAQRVMENAADPAVRLDVKLVVDAGKGPNWSEAH